MAVGTPKPDNVRMLNARLDSVSYLPLEKEALTDNFVLDSVVAIRYPVSTGEYKWDGTLVVATGAYAFAQVTCIASDDFAKLLPAGKADVKAVPNQTVKITVTEPNGGPSATVNDLKTDLYNE